MLLTPSIYQERIFEFVRSGSGSAVVIAVAGSGKTTTILEALQYIPSGQTAQILAFNKSIAVELQTRIEKLEFQRLQAGQRAFPTVRASTFHSACFGAVRAHLDGLQVDVTPRKLNQICRDWLTRDEFQLYASYICKLVGLAKGIGVGCLAPNTPEVWNGLTDHHDLTLDSDDADEGTARDLARELLDRSNQAAEEGVIDFDDQLYLTCLWNLALRPTDWVLVDEAQDTNPVRRAIAKKALKPDGRLIAVGDPHQAIYGFTGASHDAIDLIQREFHAQTFPLSVCYRCAKAIVVKAREIVPEIEYPETAEDGTLEAAVDARTVATRLGPEDAILCRNTAPLVDAAYALIAKGVGCTILGRDLGEGLVTLIEKQRAKGIEALDEKLGVYQQREVAKFERRDQHAKAEAVRDRVSCIRTIMDHLDELDRTIPALIAKIRAIFTDGGNVLLLSTIHKAKGREWPKVAILRPDLMPSKWAKQPWQQAQEQHLQYVAWTRAKTALYLLSGDLK